MIGAAALNLAASGFAVFPLWPRAKTPLTRDGFKSATCEPSKISAWWAAAPGANLGISIPSDMLVLDIDSDGALMALENNGAVVPATVTAKTPRGRHYWFRLPEGFDAHPRVGIVPGADLRAKGSYVVAPPSINEAGIPYAWEVAPEENAFADAPDWLLNFARGARAAGPSGTPAGEHIDAAAVLAGVAEGSRDVTLFRYACKLRSQGREFAEARALVLHAAGACSPRFPEPEALRKLEQAWKYEGPAKDQQPDAFKVWAAQDFFATVFPRPTWFVDQILPDGLTLVVSPAKVGKTFLVGNVALAIGYGGNALNSPAYKATRSGVLYLDLEQEESRSQERWKGMLAGEPPPLSIRYAFKWRRLGDGCLEALKRLLDSAPAIGVVVIDVLSLIWPDEEKGGGNAYHREYRVMSALREFAAEQKIALIAVHHTNRSVTADPLDRISGTAAMAGVPDVLWILSRDRDKSTGKLFVTGRRVQEVTIPLVWRPPAGWTIAASAPPTPINWRNRED